MPDIVRLNDDDLDLDNGKRSERFNFEGFVFNHRYQLLFILLGLILLGAGIFLVRNVGFGTPSKIEVLEGSTDSKKEANEIFVEAGGAVETPGVYKLSPESRVEDLLIAAGGLSADADRGWVAKYVNRAAKLVDGQKIYVVREGQEVLGEVSGAENSENVPPLGLVNINTASQKELEELPGIGPVYAQSIIDHRIYSFVEELLSREVLKKNVYEKIKDKISVY